MRKVFLAVLLLVVAILTTERRVQAINPHPRIWLTADTLANVQNKRNANDPDWLRVKAIADAALSQAIPLITVVSASNSNPVTLTTSQPLPFGGGTSPNDLYIKGGTGAWAALTNSPETAGFPATQTGSNTFTVPVDSSAFGSFAGQHVTVFKAGGEVAGYLGYGYQGSNWQDTLLSLALVYRVTGTQAYASKALELVDMMTTFGVASMISPVSQDSGRADMATTFTLAIAYDWLYDAFSAQQRTDAITTLNLWNDWTVNNAFGRGDPSTNYWEAHVTATSSAGYATYGDNPRAQEWIDWAANQWGTYFAPKFFNAPNGLTNSYTDPSGFFYTGGLAVIGWNYGGNDISRHIKYMEMVRTATGTPVAGGLAYAQTWARALMYQLKPDRVKTPTWGRWTGDWYGMYTKTGPLLLTHYLEGTTEGAWAQWFYTHYGTYPGYSEPVETAHDRLLFYKATRPATDYRLTEPTYRFSDGLAATVFWRSDWSDSASYIYFNASTTNAAAENPKSAGHVDITRGSDYLLVQSNMWKGTGDGTNGNPAMEWYHGGLGNTLYYYDGGVKCFNQDYNYDGCQSGFGIYKSPKVQLTSQYAFAENEYATAYDYAQTPSARTLQYFFRSFLTMGDGVTIVWDRIQSTSASHTKQLRWQLSSASTPVVSNGVISSTVGASKLFIAPVLPANNSIAIVRNVTGSGVPSNWHAEVTDAAPAANMTGLTLLYATSSSGSLPSMTRLSTVSAGFEALQVATSSPKVAVVPRNVSANGDGTFASATATAVALTSTHAGTALYVVAGLASGTYTVAENGSTISGGSSVVVDANGVLSFSAPAGALTITQSGATIPPPANTLSSVACVPGTVAAGASATCIATLSAAATSSSSVGLSTSVTSLQLPGAVSIPLGSTSATFTVSAPSGAASATGVVVASFGSSTVSAAMSITGTQTPPPSSGSGTYTCQNNQFVMTGDISLRGSDTVELVGSPSAPCVLSGNNHRFIVPDNSWVGHVRFVNAVINDLGNTTLDMLGGINPGDYAYMTGNAFLEVRDSAFHRSSGFNLFTVGNASVTIRNIVYAPDNVVSVDADVSKSRPWLREIGSSTATKYVQASRLQRSWIDVSSPNWIIGAARSCSQTCDADGNIMLGRRVGFGIAGTGSYASYNYVHINLDVTPNWPYWSQVASVSRVGAGALVENNVIRSAHWVAQLIDGDLSNNVLLELHPHEFVRIGTGGQVHHNILSTLYPGIDRYDSTTRLESGDSAFGLVQSTNKLSIFNNTLDARGSAVRSVVSVIEGAELTSFRNNATYRLALTAIACPTAFTCTSAVGGPVDWQDPSASPFTRARYIDYNSYFYEPTDNRRVAYALAVANRSLCDAGYGGNDLGGCPNANVDPQFRGPLPMGTGHATLASSNDSGFPFNDTDISSGLFTVSQILSYYRWVYAPAPGSPLIGRQDPADGAGEIGAVQLASVPGSAPAIVTTNKRPMVYAGPSFAVGDPTSTVHLSGYAADDAMPSGILTLAWTQVDGPGTVAFQQSNRSLTTATFSAPGIYTLRLSAQDGALASTSDVQIGVGVPLPGNGFLPQPPSNVRLSSN